MVDDFRDYARLPAPVFAGLDLNALVQEVLALYETSKAPIVRKLASGLPKVRADSAQIRQVLHNLVQNAQDALEHQRSAAEQPVIEVCTETAGDKVRLSITDNGGGFPEELMARIFEPYVTTIENRVAKGASVTILLPVSETAAKAA
jgi:nitrogen fixation/metabolism regulation signal transduction histidine kinase